jgi:hypothetical protein
MTVLDYIRSSGFQAGVQTVSQEEILHFNRFAGLALAALLLPALAPAAVIVDKSPDVGPYWHPLSGDSTYVYASSFVFNGASGTMVDTLGVYMLFDLQEGGGSPAPFRFELLGDNSNAPDPANVLAVTGYQTFSGTSLQLVTSSLLVPYSLSSGTRYWIAASTVGQQGAGDYQVGAHTPNSIYNDNGTFWYSNDPNGLNFDGTGFTPEMAIYAAGEGQSAIPEPATMALCAAGLGLLALIRRRP